MTLPSTHPLIWTEDIFDGEELMSLYNVILIDFPSIPLKLTIKSPWYVNSCNKIADFIIIFFLTKKAFSYIFQFCTYLSNTKIYCCYIMSIVLEQLYILRKIISEWSSNLIIFLKFYSNDIFFFKSSLNKIILNIKSLAFFSAVAPFSSKTSITVL